VTKWFGIAMAVSLGLSTTSVAHAASAANATPIVSIGTAKPIIIAHRGASGERPEHTLASYTLAIEQGADFIEPDLVLTKDGVLVARHENEISGTTNVAAHPEFAARKRTQIIDGEVITGWFTEDFTLAELKTLRARERLPQLRPANTAYDGQFEIPTLQEIIDLVKTAEKAQNRRIGIYPETKHPTHFATIGLPFEDELLRVLKANGYSKKTDPIFIQSFEVNNLKVLRPKTKLRLVHLMASQGAPYDQLIQGNTTSWTEMTSNAGLKAIALYADGIGVEKALIMPRDAAGNSIATTDLVTRAHEAGLKVHAWTFRAENYFLPTELRQGDAASPTYLAQHGKLKAEIQSALALGLDGVFTDFPGIGDEARR
jgi:glycerophosphoryl diester phosphodiesterase